MEQIGSGQGVVQETSALTETIPQPPTPGKVSQDESLHCNDNAEEANQGSPEPCTGPDTKTLTAADQLEMNPSIDKEKRHILISEADGYPFTKLYTRRKRASTRLMQSKAYSELVEDRIVDLEQKVREILKQPEPSNNDEESQSDIPGSVPGIEFVDWAKFSAKKEIDPKAAAFGWSHRPELDSEQKSVIEVLREEPRHRYSMKRDGDADTDAIRGPKSQVVETTLSAPREHSTQPYRIRIRSKLLLSLIHESTEFSTVSGPHKHRLVFFRPFKLLVSCADTLQKQLKQLNRLHEQIGNQSSDNGTITREPGGEESHAGERPQLPLKETQTSEARQHLEVLCRLLDEHLKSQVQLRHNISATSGKVSFSDLWYIFKPGCEVRTPRKSGIQLYRVVKVTAGRGVMAPLQDPPELSPAKRLKEQGYAEGSFIIECFYIHFDGARFGPVSVTFQIRKFEGEKEVTSLPVYPFNCDPQKEETHERLLSRGRRFAELSNPKALVHRKYKGLTLDQRQQQVDSEVIVDFQLAFIEQSEKRPTIGLEGLVDDDRRELHDGANYGIHCDIPGCCSNEIVYRDYEVDERERDDFKEKKEHLFNSIDNVDQLTDEHRVLLPPQAYGFVLRTRKWAAFDIDLLEDIQYDNGWEKLVIDKHMKDVVLALVENHERPRHSQPQMDSALSSVDLVQGKGRGLIILLHGEPGVGKTSTAECVASYTKRPLFPITCGDIGDRAESVEESLERNFQLAHKWGCVLLLDEADIFLTKRTNDDIQRNSIVSVFLRTLEYYSGILFLTTNRVGTIDRAFKSRIHLSLHYPKLNKGRTLKIWENNLERVKEDFKKEGKEINCNDDDILNFAKQHFKQLKKDVLLVWNGRQIRNAFQTAIAMANYDAKSGSNVGNVTPVLSSKQFKKVAAIARDFDLYLKGVYSGKDDAQLAKEQKLRDDEWGGATQAGYKKPVTNSDEDDWWSSESTDSHQKNHKKRKHGFDREDTHSDSESTPNQKKKKRKR